MTLALYGKSRKRQGGLLLAALLAVIAATIGGLMLIGTAFAHIANYTATAQCNRNWVANANYSQGGTLNNADDRRLIILHGITVDGQSYAASWSSGAGNFTGQWGTSSSGPKG